MTDPRIDTARESNNDQGFHSGLPAEGPDPDAEDDRDE